MTRLIVRFPPGGGTDALARILSKRLEADMGETVLVENKPGAGGNIAHDYVAAAAPDGKTLLFTTNSLVINPLIYPNVKFNALKSYAPVMALAHSPVIILTRPGAPFSTQPEMLSYAKANPGKVSYSSCGNGGIDHLAAEQLKSVTGIRMVHIPYRGCAPAVMDLAGAAGIRDVVMTIDRPGETLRATGNMGLQAGVHRIEFALEVRQQR